MEVTSKDLEINVANKLTADKIGKEHDENHSIDDQKTTLKLEIEFMRFNYPAKKVLRPKNLLFTVKDEDND